MTGIYAQDQIKWDRWRFILGGRHDWMSSDFSNGANFSQHEGKTTGRAAAAYVMPSGIAPYVSYATSFTPNPGAILNGTVAQPTLGEQFEAGVKYDLPGAKASLRAAAFDLRQRNAVVFEVVAAVNQQVQLDLHNRGIELEAVASLANGLNLQASYSYIDAEITRLTAATVGNQLTSVPHHTASLWLDYTVQDGSARGLGMGGGVRYIGSSFGDNLNRAVIENAPRALIDGSIRYDLVNFDPRLKGFMVQVSGTNLLDTEKQVCTSGYCYWDEGRKVIAGLRYRW